MKLPFNRIRWWLWLFVGWVWSAVVCAELLGYPHLFGWPVWIVRGEGAPSTPAWVIVVDALTALLAVAATTLVADWCSRSSSPRFQFRLSTLMGLVAVIAVLIGAWRADIPSFETLESSDKIPVMVVMVDLTCRYAWRPIWMQGPLSVLIRLGVLLGLGCIIYSAGRFAMHVGVQCLMRWKAR